jgi:ferredoxin-NADP reductase
MLRTQFTLIEKKMLTHDVYELIYSCPSMLDEYPKHGQYVMFQLAPGLNRAYSIASFEGENFTLIIKRIPDGRGSPIICDAEVGTTFSGMLPLGHFVLQDNTKNKCFIGTGTGFAPLYCMIEELDKRNMPVKAHFSFWVRNNADIFYFDELAKISSKYLNFQFNLHTSREECAGTFPGYVTDILDEDKRYIFNRSVAEKEGNLFGKYMNQFEEFYICGSPAMVKSAREKLEALGVVKEDIFWEQF